MGLKYTPINVRKCKEKNWKESQMRSFLKVVMSRNVLNFGMKAQVINDVQIEHKYQKWACNFHEIGIMAKRKVGNQKNKLTSNH